MDDDSKRNSVILNEFSNFSEFLQNPVIEGYEVFNKSKISGNKIHLALKITQDHLIKAINFIANKSYLKELSLFTKIDFSYSLGNEELILLLNQLIASKKEERSKSKKIIDKLSQVSNELKTEIQTTDTKILQNQFEETKKNMNKLRTELLKAGKNCTEDDLRILFSNLDNYKDDFEISIGKNLTKIILNTNNISIPEIRNLLSNFSVLNKKMIEIHHADKTDIPKDVLFFIANTTNDIIYEIDPNKSDNANFIVQYKHLLNFAIYILAAADYLINLIKFKDLSTVIENLSSNILVNPKLLNYINEFKEEYNISNVINKEIEGIDSYILDIRENNKLLFEDIHNIENEQRLSPDYFTFLNEELQIDERNIQDLYDESKKIYHSNDNKEARNNFQTTKFDSVWMSKCGILGYCYSKH